MYLHAWQCLAAGTFAGRTLVFVPQNPALFRYLSCFATMTPVTIIGSLAALLTTVAYVPQAYQTIRTRDTSALSLPTFLMLFVGTCLWGTYAVLIHDIPILLTNLISGGLATIILYIKLTNKPGDKVARTL